MKKTHKILAVAVMILSLAFIRTVHAQNVPTVNYGNQPAVDSDSDGLTDEGERQLYHTDPGKSDTDGDGFGDGVEILSGTDPLDANSYPGMKTSVTVQNDPQTEIPWAWYTARAAGLLSFALLWLSIFLGIAIRTPFLNKLVKPSYSYASHCFISLLALLFALFHGLALTFDKTMHFSLVDILVPFASNFQPALVALGILAFYLMLLMVVTSYARKLVSHKVWRVVHTTNIILYAIGIAHAIYLGTDLQNGTAREIFIWANALLVFLFLANIEVRLAAFSKKTRSSEQPS